MATSRYSSLVMMQTLKSFKTILFEVIFLLDSYSLKSLKIFGLYGLSDAFTKTWSGGISCVFVVSSLSTIVVDGSKSFSFPGCSLVRIVSSTTPGSMSLVHGFTHDKNVPYLFSTHFKQDLNSKLKFLSTCWRNSPQQITSEACCI